MAPYQIYLIVFGKILSISKYKNWLKNMSVLQNKKLKSWYSNRYQIVLVQRNILLVFTVISAISLSVAVVFVKTMISSKSLEPYVIEVDAKTGAATVVQQLSSENFTGNQMMQRYFVNKFIQAASGYDPKNYRQTADEVRVLSTPPIYNDYKNRINPWQLGAKTQINIRIKSLMFKDSSNVQVRTSKQVIREEGGSETKDEVINVSFYFAPEVNLTMEERMINPLGFQVTRYEVAEEIFSY
jgi:type IV secretion system protein VirB8